MVINTELSLKTTLMPPHSTTNFQVENLQIYISLSGCLFDKRRLNSSGIGTYLSRYVPFQRLAPEINK